MHVVWQFQQFSDFLFETVVSSYQVVSQISRSVWLGCIHGKYKSICLWAHTIYMLQLRLKVPLNYMCYQDALPVGTLCVYVCNTFLAILSVIMEEEQKRSQCFCHCLDHMKIVMYTTIWREDSVTTILAIPFEEAAILQIWQLFY